MYLLPLSTCIYESLNAIDAVHCCGFMFELFTPHCSVQQLKILVIPSLDYNLKHGTGFPGEAAIRTKKKRAVCDSCQSKLEAYSKEEDRGGRMLYQFTLRDLK